MYNYQCFLKLRNFVFYLTLRYCIWFYIYLILLTSPTFIYVWIANIIMIYVYYHLKYVVSKKKRFKKLKVYFENLK